MVKKAVLSNRIYLSGCTKEELEILTSVLRYTIVQQAGLKRFTEVINHFTRVSPTVCSIPSGREDLIPTDYEIIDKRTVAPVQFPKFNGTLRPSQQEIYDALKGTCIINAPVSWGKTFSALSIAAKLGQKTLIITHTTMLRDQWIKEIDKVFGIKAGIVGTGKFDIEPIIVVGNIQSLNKRMNELSDLFGTVILDELHHCPANTFASVLDKSKATHKIGLSGTLIRKDQKHILFPDFFGYEVFKPEKENCMTPQVVIVDTPIVLKPGKEWALRITDLEVYNESYRKMILELASNAASKGYKVLVVATRVDFLEWGARQLPNAASITGAIKSIDERMAILNKLSTGELDIIFGTMSIFSEGISQNDLSCLILATPTNNESLLTQLIGRIIREVPDKKQPLIIDIALKGNSVKTQNLMRMGHYVKSGYQIRTLKL